MKKLTREQVFDIIAQQIDDPQITLNNDSSMENIEYWDSLVHLGILVALDVELDGKAADIKELARSKSVKEILNCLNENQLLAD